MCWFRAVIKTIPPAEGRGGSPGHPGHPRTRSQRRQKYLCQKSDWHRSGGVCPHGGAPSGVALRRSAPPSAGGRYVVAEGVTPLRYHLQRRGCIRRHGQRLIQQIRGRHLAIGDELP